MKLMQRPINADVSSLKITHNGSAPLPVELFRNLSPTGIKLRRLRMTEATCNISVNPIEGEKIGSVGIPLP